MSSKDLFKQRYNVMQIIIGVMAVIFLLRLFYVQLIDRSYKAVAQSQAIKERDVYPTRGLVYDRNGELVVYNEAIYDLMMVPREVKHAGGFDTAKLCELLHITKQDVQNRIVKMRNTVGYSYYRGNIFAKQLSLRDYSKFQEFLYLFPGFYGQVRTIRKYPHACAATILGDIGEVDERQITKSDGYYKPGDYVGKSGIEKVYEKELGGIRGKRLVFYDAHGREQGSYENGEFDTLAKAGDNVISTLDIKLQEYGERLMANKKGSIVAIEPATGEILALVSSPSYDPNLLCGAIRGENFKMLLHDTLLPLYSRPTLATYPPGSAFKPVVGLIALNEGVQGVNYTVPCNGMYFFAGLSLHCSHHHPSATNIQYALCQSCNPYFWQTFRNTIESNKYARIQDIYGKWVEYCNSFGLGVKTVVDLPYESSGNIPSVKYFNRIYGEKGWHSSTIISLGIGQGEITVTPLQMANIMVAIANGGFWFTPHVVKRITDVITGKDVTHEYEKHIVKIDPQHFKPVQEGLLSVVEAGTAKAARVEGITMCGKTGTAQNPHGDNHSMFAGYAPYEQPKIAIAVVVENGGYGSTYAAPIASLMVEKYLNDTIQETRKPIEKRMLETNLLAKYGIKVAKPADAAE